MDKMETIGSIGWDIPLITELGAEGKGYQDWILDGGYMELDPHMEGHGGLAELVGTLVALAPPSPHSLTGPSDLTVEDWSILELLVVLQSTDSVTGLLNKELRTVVYGWEQASGWGDFGTADWLAGNFHGLLEMADQE